MSPPLDFFSQLIRSGDIGPWAFKGVSAALILLVAYTLAELTWVAVSDSVDTSRNDLPLSSAPADVPGVGVGTNTAVQNLSQQHLFGKQQTRSGERVSVRTVEKTRLKLVLRGLIVTDDEQSARAIISMPSGKEDFYGIGDELPKSGVSIDSIHSDHVVLSHNGKLEALYLTKERTTINLSKDHGEREIYRDTGYASSADSRAALYALRDAWRKGTNHMMQTLGPRPVTEGGELLGYEITAPRGNLAERLGLRKGDVIRQINGVDIGETAEIRMLIRKLPKAAQIELLINRDGGPQTLVMGR